ncbi:K(+)-transporting ATPase subunit F (plasmid) [Paracoccus aestuarii]|nr:K(+)-transporting ATPase subunit F [Paracoccus aestuarii]
MTHVRHHLSRARCGRVSGFHDRDPRADAPVTEGQMFDLILGLAVAAGLLGYLVVALMHPDRF